MASTVELSEDQLRLLLTMAIARRIRGYVIGDADRIVDGVLAAAIVELGQLGVTLAGQLTVEDVDDV